ncbi:desmoplakin, partial [Reticulomyxa filosa]
DILKEAKIPVMSRADIFQALRAMPDSCVHKEFEAKLRGKPNAQVVILHPNDHEKMNGLYEKYRDISQSVKKFQKALTTLEENNTQCKTKVEKACEDLIGEINQHKENLFAKIDAYKSQKKEILTKQLNDLKTKEDEIKQLNDQLTDFLSDSELEINERRDKICKLLQTLTLDSMKWSDVPDIESDVIVDTNITSISNVLF